MNEENTDTTINPSPPDETSSISNPKENYSRSIIGICAVGLIVSFFLPWVNFFGETMTGLKLVQDGGEFGWFCIIPIFGALTLASVISKFAYKFAAIFTGLTPFAALIYTLKVDKELYLIFGLGAWTTLALGGVLILLSILTTLHKQ